VRAKLEGVERVGGLCEKDTEQVRRDQQCGHSKYIAHGVDWAL
jgi:hypothetical protein